MAFASSDDIADRLGRDLSAGEAQSVALLLEGAQAVIEDCAGLTEAEIAALERNGGTSPPILRFVAIELVVRAIANPNNVASLSETLGQHSYSARFRDAGLLLTKAEELIVRRAAFGSTTAATQTEATQAEEIHDLYYGS